MILRSKDISFVSWRKDGPCIGEYAEFRYSIANKGSDSCEWENFESLFDESAYVYTTWSGKTFYKDFIEASKRGVENGVFIMHRCHGISTEINEKMTRAASKMKATITQRFVLDGCEVDAESDCRFVFFWHRIFNASKGQWEWKAKFVRHWYEKDKLIPVDPRRCPSIDDELLQSFPPGYRYLAYCQEKVMGVKVDANLPGHIREKQRNGSESPVAKKHDLLYWQIKDWLEDCDIDF